VFDSPMCSGQVKSYSSGDSVVDLPNNVGDHYGLDPA
jgi:hypothetical protein